MQSQNETPNEIAIDTARASSKANINAVYKAIKANTDISGNSQVLLNLRA